MGHQEHFRSELAAGFEVEKNKANLDWRCAFECLDRRRDVSLAEHDHRHRELRRAIKEVEEKVLSCRPREAASKARVSLLRELASAGNPASLEGAPSTSGGGDLPHRAGRLAGLRLPRFERDEEARANLRTSCWDGRVTSTKGHVTQRLLLKLSNWILRRRWRSVRKMGVTARTAAETTVKTTVTTSRGRGTALARAPGTPFCGTQVTRTKQMVDDAFARAEAEERGGQTENRVLEGILRALCLGPSPSTLHQALQQLQPFEVPEKTSFAGFLSELRIAVMNAKDVALVR